MPDSASEALRMMAYGFYSITSYADGDANAMVANWVMQTSFEPQLVAVGLQKTSFTYGLVERGEVFGVNIFREEDSEIITRLTKGREKQPDKMDEVEYRPAPETDCPVLAGAAAYVECRVVQMIDVGGDHDILVGRVVGGDVMKEGAPNKTLTLPDLGWSYAG